MKKLKKWFSKGISKIEGMRDAQKNEDQMIDDILNNEGEID